MIRRLPRATATIILLAVVTPLPPTWTTSPTWLVSAEINLVNATNDDNEPYCLGFSGCLPWRSPELNRPPISTNSDACGVWLAPSTIPGGGLGVFAGKDYGVGDVIGASGDIVIPIVDLILHQPDSRTNGTFLWDEYTWNNEQLQMIQEGWKEVSSASPGISASFNCFIDLSNVCDWQPSNDFLLDRRYDPGAGAVTTYQNRWTSALRPIRPGEELFITYGEKWFHLRRHMGPIPLTGDLERATTLLRRYKRLIFDHSALTRTTSTVVPSSTSLWNELWMTFVVHSAWKSTSRTLGSFNASNADEELNDLQQKYNNSLYRLRRSHATRDLHWLQEHGDCVDHLREGPSTLPHAGRGAFSVRFLKQGSVVAPMPMIQIPYSRRLNMYELTTDTKGQNVIKEPRRVVGKQLLLNYCYGHEESTMLLCPYGSYVNLVNHNQSLANVRLRWADPAKSILNATLLEQSVKFIDDHFPRKAVLALELFALRDIAAGEEIFLDYGDAWEAAWQLHLRLWQNKPISSPAPAVRWNADKNTRLRTVFEQIEHPYPPDIELMCDQSFREQNRLDWEPLLNEPNAADLLEVFRRWNADMLVSCDVLRWRFDGRRLLYTALLDRPNLDSADDSDEKNYENLVDVPREAFTFVNRPYKSDMFSPHAFRHAIMIPNDLFPEAWKNRNLSEAEI